MRIIVAQFIFAFMAISLALNSMAAPKMSDLEFDKQIAVLLASDETAYDDNEAIIELKKLVDDNDLSKERLIQSYYHIARLSYELDQISQSLQYADKALEIIGPSNNHQLASILLVFKGYSMNILLIDRADLVLLQAIESAAKFGNSIDEIDAYFLMADYFIQKRQYITAHTYTAKAIDLAEEKDIDASIADGHALNGTIYFQMEDYTDALDEINLALAHYIALKNDYNVISMKLLSGLIYLAQAEFSKAEDVYQELLANIKNTNSVRFHSYTGLAKSKFEQGKYDEAMDFIRQSEPLILNVENTNAKIRWYLQKLNVLIELRESAQALALLKAIENSKYFPIDTMDIEKTAEIYKIKSRLYELDKQYEKALENYKIYYQQEATNKKNKSDKVGEEIRVKYFSDKKDEKLNQITHQLEINKLKLSNKEQESHYQRLLIIFGLCLFLVFTYALVKQIKIRRELSKMLHTDSLTNVLNRYSLIKTGNKVFADRKNEDKDMSTILLDIDDFKAINDTYGHAVGDSVLKKVAFLGNEATRENDWFGRMGGEEFVAILPNANELEATVVAERIRDAIYQFDWKQLNVADAVSVSVGVASVDSIELGEHKLSFNSLLNLSDKAMYMAKRTGKNKVIQYSSINT